MNDRKDFTDKSRYEYLGVPIRDEDLTDELRSADVFKIDQSTITDPNGRYRQIEILVTDPATVISTGNTVAVVEVPFNAFLTGVCASLSSVSTSGSVQVRINNFAGSNILSSNIIIEQGKSGTHTSVAKPSIDPSKNFFFQHEKISVDITSAGTNAAGLIVVLYFNVLRFFAS